MAQDIDATRGCRLSMLLSREKGRKEERRGVSEDTEGLSAPIVKELVFTMWTCSKSS